MEDLIKLQYELEEEASAMGTQRVQNARQDSIKHGQRDNLGPENYLIRKAVMAVADEISGYLAEHTRGDKEYVQMRKILVDVDPADLAYLTLQMLFNTSRNRKLISLGANLATKISNHIDYLNFKEANPNYIKTLEKYWNSSKYITKEEVLKMLMDKEKVEKQDWRSNKQLSAKLGIFLIQQAIQATALFEIHNDGVDSSFITLSQTAEDWIDKAHIQCGEMSPFHLPMVIKPMKWAGIYSGGYLSCAGDYKIPVVRTTSDEVLERLTSCLTMPKVYDALNVIQETGFRINKRVLEVMQECKATGLGGLPQQDVDRLLPPKFSQEEKNLWPEEKQKAYRVECAKIYQAYSADLSKRLTINWQLWLGEKFKDFDSIYFPVNMDWRGRIYYIPSYVHPQSDQYGKALLLFADGKPLGETGAKWLAIHGANCAGVDKVSLEDRVKWVNEHEAEILDSASNPLDGNRFWTTVDEPFLFLAFCFEWQGYKAEGQDYVSHLPCSWDGSCSGLQHFSAMLRDQEGGALTNLIPQEKPADIYMRVASLATAHVAADTENEEAQHWNGKVDRTIAKRNCMTYCYSATEYGMTDQLYDELKKRDEKLKIKGGERYIPGISGRRAARYMARVNLMCIEQVVSKAAEAMEWLKSVAKITATAGHNIHWTAPNGMLVIQKYHKNSIKRIRSLTGGIDIRTVMRIDDEKRVCPRRNQAGIAPNFVHSHDAAHLSIVALKSMQEGITSFMMIHDSFGVHAADSERFNGRNGIIRETFVEMYSQNILEGLKAQLAEQLSPEIFNNLPPVPQMGSLDLSQVLESDYFFS